MKAVILQSNYIPWKGYFDLIHDADVFVFYDEVKYTKNDWRNRNRIYAPNGPHWLTIPISPKAVSLKISEVVMATPRWQEEHFKSLQSAYGKSPCYRQLYPVMEELYLKREWTRLVDLNRFSIEKISRLIGIQTRFVDSKDFCLQGGAVERLIDLLTKLGASEYITGSSAKNYFKDEESLFQRNGIKLTYKDYSGYPEYPQRRPSFVHEVSVLDMIANLSFDQIGQWIWGWRQLPASAKENRTD